MAKTLRRPTKEMMQAVNAAIAGGNKKKVTQLVNEHRLSRKELEARLEIRDGEKYNLRKKKPVRRVKASKVLSTSPANGPVEGILKGVDGRTGTVTLVQVEARVQELLGQKPKTEVTKVKKAMAEVEVLRRKYEDAKGILGLT